MLLNSLVSGKLQKCFSTATPSVLKPGDVLRQTRMFNNEHVLRYSEVSQDSNPLHFDYEAARNVGFEGPLVHGMLVASVFPRIISSHFVSLTLNTKHYLRIWSMLMLE